MSSNKLLTIAALASCLATGASAQSTPQTPGHPGPQDRVGLSTQEWVDGGNRTIAITPEGPLPGPSPFDHPPGANFLQTVFENMRDGFGNEMPNTLPSHPDDPYNLHEDPVVTPINPVSPTDDLTLLFREIGFSNGEDSVDIGAVQDAIDILEGNPVPDRVYSGLPLLHYNGPLKVKQVEPIFDEDGNKIGGNVNVHQVWYDNHIEADTAFIDPSEVLDVPWTITYTVDVLSGGHDDFSPFVMYLDDPELTAPAPPAPHVAMDQTFFPMAEGTRSVFEIDMSLGKYWNLTYIWGWRFHPPRVQVIENARKGYNGKNLVQHEIDVFGENPRASEAAKFRAISKIGPASPAKRMWQGLRLIRFVGRNRIGDPDFRRQIIDRQLVAIEKAFSEWKRRDRLPDLVPRDPEAHMTLFYVNNTIYGELNRELASVGPANKLEGWEERPFTYKVHLVNGDFFEHGYAAVDFGGRRGWENQFQPTVPLAGSGAWFTFGRVHWMPNAGLPGFPRDMPGGPPGGRGRAITVEPYRGMNDFGEHWVDLTLNFEPSRRLRLYQFDPGHHDVAVWSLH